MELSSHGEYCDFNDEKELVNVFGGVAYDHDSMPKVVAVHTLSPEKLNKQHSSIIDGLPRNIIGIRSKPKKLRNLSIQRPCIDFREQDNSFKSVSWSFPFWLIYCLSFNSVPSEIAERLVYLTSSLFSLLVISWFGTT